jgi:hypothetical protein
MAPRVSGSIPSAQPVGAGAVSPSSAGSREREASQGSAAATSARSLARALERDLAGSAAAGGASTRQRQRRERKGGEKNEAAASQCRVERRRAVERRAFMGWSA